MGTEGPNWLVDMRAKRYQGWLVVNFKTLHYRRFQMHDAFNALLTRLKNSCYKNFSAVELKFFSVNLYCVRQISHKTRINCTTLL